MHQKLAKLEELKQENKRLKQETYELYKKYHDENPSLKRELNVYMLEESYQLVATQEKNAIAAQDQAEAMWRDCEEALAE